MKTLSKPAAKIPAPSIVVFEVGDANNLSDEVIGKDPSYVFQLRDFIESMGYEVYKPSPGIDAVLAQNKIEINGQRFHVDYTNCGRYSKNIYTREITERKPENRFIRILTREINGSTIIKLIFNKEYDANKLRDKIDAAIKERLDKETRLKNWHEQKKTNTILVAKHYQFPGLESMSIHQGEVTFYFPGGSIKIDATGAVTNIHLNAATAKDAKEAVATFKQLERAINLAVAADQHFHGTTPLSDEIQAWVNTANHESYDYVTEKYSK